MEAADGRITGLLGPNGAGKTTTLRMLGGLFKPDAGSITVDGLPTGQAALARMGILSDAHGLYPRLSARENIVYYGRLQGMSRDAANTRAEQLADMLDMRSLLERRTDGFSQGERMKTSLARALVHDPANIVLDEPTNGLDVLATRSLRETLRHLRSPEGGAKCIVFSTHIMQEVEQLCDRVVIVSGGRSVAEGTVEELLAQAGESRFEDGLRQAGLCEQRGSTTMSRITHDIRSAAWVVFLKELVDATRDRRTLARILIPAILMGPLMLLALSGLLASFEERADRREITVVGIEHAPTLRNYLERQTYTIKEAPADYEAKLRSSKLLDPVLVVPKDFERELLEGDQPTLELVTDAANQRANAGAGTVKRLLGGFSRERASLQLALRGVPGALLQPVDVQERDLASPQARASTLTGIVPMFIMMAVLYGAMTAALDSTAGERERGSLEPLLMNPVSPIATVLGKWGAVALLGMAVALLADLSFVPAQWLIKSDSLQAMFSFGPA